MPHPFDSNADGFILQDDEAVGEAPSPTSSCFDQGRSAARAAGSKTDEEDRLLHFAKFFDGYYRTSSGYLALCPFHDDTNPSLSINEGDDGHILLHCFARCPTKDICDVTGLRMADLMPGAKLPLRTVATYDYLDEHGELRHQTVRHEPKSFKQRAPDGKGGWCWSLKDVRRVLYRLPELMVAEPSQPVFICEGEKDADRLATLGLLATTNVCGATYPWTDDYTEALRGRRVVLLPDNDDAGWDRVRRIARDLKGAATSVKIVELPNLPAKGDVSDWLNVGGTAQQLLHLVEETPDESTGRQDDRTNCRPVEVSKCRTDSADAQEPEESSEPSSCRPVEVSNGPVEPFPVEVLPKTLQRFVTSIAAALPCPPDFPGAMMLPVLSAFIGRRRCIEIKSGWVEYPLLWVACVARSGDRKTPAFQKVTEPLRTKQQELLANYLEEKAAYEELSAGEKKEADRPRLVQLLVTDTTIEALKDVLNSNPNGVIYAADELSGWARSFSQYKGGKGDDKQHWLSIWSGVQIVCNRKTLKEPIVVAHPFVPVAGGIQPDALSDLSDEAREDGITARILFTCPDPLPPAPFSEATVEGMADYAAVCAWLWNLEPSSEPIVFSPRAKARWVEWINAHRQEVPPDHLRPFWSKCEGYCARLALALYLVRRACNETKATCIDEPSVDGAAKLITYFWSHAVRVYATMADRTDKSRIGNALRWIRKKGGTVTARIVHQYGLCSTAEDAKQLLHHLAELRYGLVTNEKRNSVVFRLNGTTGRQDDVSEEKP